MITIWSPRHWLKCLQDKEKPVFAINPKLRATVLSVALSNIIFIMYYIKQTHTSGISCFKDNIHFKHVRNLLF